MGWIDSIEGVLLHLCSLTAPALSQWSHLGCCQSHRSVWCFTHCMWSRKVHPRDFNRLRISEFTQNFWAFSFYIADFWQTFWVIWENGSNWSNLRLKMSVSALGRLKNHNVPHLHPNFTMFMPLNRLQLKICAFSGKFNVCSKWVLLSWIEIYRDFTLQTQIFTQKYRSWLRFYSEFLRKKLAAGGSGILVGDFPPYNWIVGLDYMETQVKCQDQEPMRPKIGRTLSEKEKT